MYPSPRKIEHTPFDDSDGPIELQSSLDDFFSVKHPRSIKRAKSTRDAFPPSHSRAPSTSISLQRRSYHNARSLVRRRSDEWSGVRIKSTHSWSLSAESSDLESLPDLSDSNSTTESIQSAVTPTKSVNAAPFLFDFSTPIAANKFSYLELRSLEIEQDAHPKPSIFEIPELVHKIIEYADYQNIMISKEASPVRRGNFNPPCDSASSAVDKQKSKREEGSSPTASRVSRCKALYSCLLVNKLFNRITREVLGTKIYFDQEQSYFRFVESEIGVFETMRPRAVVLNKLFHARQASLEKIAHTIDYTSLEWLEIFMCPKLKPPISFLHASLKSLIITGSKVADDSLLISVAENCPSLEVLDVRACEGITDYGIYSIAVSCQELRSVNFGRKRKGHLITDHSVSRLARNNPKLHTVGLAGCHITDRAIWQLAITCGMQIERLSLNNCSYLTNSSIPLILSHNLMPKLSVLEVRFIENLTNFDPILTFKRRQNARGISVLIETCQTLHSRLAACEKRMDSRISQRIFRDISEWANQSDDEDVSHDEFARTRVAVA